MEEQDKRQRKIRSYVLREGRLTPGQENAFSQYWKTLGIDYDANKPLDFPIIFGNDNPVYLEIGFGNGESLASMAQSAPERNYLGIEVHTPGVGHLLINLAEHDIGNVRIIRHDAIEVLEHMIPASSLAGVQLFFADPWPKRKHHKRRIVQRAFLERIAKLIKTGGTFHAATDWQDYAIHMMDVLTASPDLFGNSAGTGNYIERPTDRPITKFEKRGTNKGHSVWDLIFTRN